MVFKRMSFKLGRWIFLTHPKTTMAARPFLSKFSSRVREMWRCLQRWAMEANMSKSTTQRLFGWSQCPHLVLMLAFVKQAVVLEERRWSTGLHFKVRTKALIQESLNLMNSPQGPSARRYRLVFRIRWAGKVGGFNQSFEQTYRWQTTHSYLAKIDQAWKKGPSLPPL